MNALEFKIFFQILKNRISDGEDVPSFMRYLISSITELSESDWGAPKDPTDRVKESTLRNYSKSNLSKKMAQSIVYRLNKDDFITEIDSKPKDALKLLADDIRPYNPSVSPSNVNEVVADIFIDIIRTSAGLTSQDKLEAQKQLASSTGYKNKYGKYLLKECDNHCAMPGCGKILYVSNKQDINDVYEVILIDKTKDNNIKNLIALCPQCFATYQMDNSSKTKNLLKRIKNPCPFIWKIC
ncbi:hypothetical protein [Mycoplasmopsis meleagridis]|uniref:hypothetical protein n=1 Tax=Mycoplasmopsis meleagridis TaxID=29561 RepID=UPI001C657FFB|nr:hypothetical protein [Mycoplasmopsis meleagridis]